MKKKMRIYSMLAILGLILVVSGTSYAVLSLILEGTVDNVLRLGNLSLVLDESNVITLSNALPISDEEGLLSDAYSFSVENDGTIESGYKIYLDDDVIEVGENRIPSSNIRYELRVDGAQDTIANLSDDSTELYVSNIAPGVVVNFELRIWVDYDVTSIQPNTVHTSKLRIEGSQILNIKQPNPPVLSEDLIPVTYGVNGEVYKADVNSEWYNYFDKEWANAVTVSSGTKATYNSAAAGTEILMNDIEQMVVWIPRYSYDPASIVSADEAIDVEFANLNEEAHPAFCWGNYCQTDRSNAENVEMSGIWIGKFEIANRAGEDENTPDVSYVVKPNLNSVHDSNISTMYDKINDISISNGDVHMMKNTEWGLVTYFSQSKYGVCNSDGTCTSKVANNAYYNSSTYDITTGCGPVMSGDVVTDNASATVCPDSSKWNTTIGQEASTTNNIYGIYDMAGGKWEYVMVNMEDASGNFYPSYSGFSSAPEKKYYDEYEYSADYTDYSRGLQGDVTKELNPDSTTMTNWNGDHAYFVASSHSWFIRGGLSSAATYAGVFSFNRNAGVAYSYLSARLSLFVTP